MSGSPGTSRPARRRPSLAAVVVLTVTWVLLWDRVSLFLVVTGVLLSVLVFVVFPLPRIERSGRVRLPALARLVGRLLVDVVRSSVRVVALAFSRRTPRGAIIRVQLRSRSDLITTITAELVSLVPGSIVLEVRRADSTLTCTCSTPSSPPRSSRPPATCSTPRRGRCAPWAPTRK